MAGTAHCGPGVPALRHGRPVSVLPPPGCRHGDRHRFVPRGGAAAGGAPRRRLLPVGAAGRSGRSLYRRHDGRADDRRRQGPGGAGLSGAAGRGARSMHRLRRRRVRHRFPVSAGTAGGRGRRQRRPAGARPPLPLANPRSPGCAPGASLTPIRSVIHASTTSTGNGPGPSSGQCTHGWRQHRHRQCPRPPAPRPGLPGVRHRPRGPGQHCRRRQLSFCPDRPVAARRHRAGAHGVSIRPAPGQQLQILDELLRHRVALDTCIFSTSIAGVRARAGNSGYALSKATLNMLGKLYALENPQVFFSVLGMCNVDTHLSRTIATLPLEGPFPEIVQLRERAHAISGYVPPVKPTITPIEVPPESRLGALLPNAYFHDAYELERASDDGSVLEMYLDGLTRTPGWVHMLMDLRNRVVALVGLKDLGGLAAFDKAKPASAYREGDRLGIFSILHLSDDELILGDSDRHLDVRVSVCKLTRLEQPRIAVSTVRQADVAAHAEFFAAIEQLHLALVGVAHLGIEDFAACILVRIFLQVFKNHHANQRLILARALALDACGILVLGRRQNQLFDTALQNAVLLGNPDQRLGRGARVVIGLPQTFCYRVGHRVHPAPAAGAPGSARGRRARHSFWLVRHHRHQPDDAQPGQRPVSFFRPRVHRLGPFAAHGFALVVIVGRAVLAAAAACRGGRLCSVLAFRGRCPHAQYGPRHLSAFRNALGTGPVGQAGHRRLAARGTVLRSRPGRCVAPVSAVGHQPAVARVADGLDVFQHVALDLADAFHRRERHAGAAPAARRTGGARLRTAGAGIACNAAPCGPDSRASTAPGELKMARMASAAPARGPLAGPRLGMPVLAIGGEKSFGATMAAVMRNAASNATEAVVPGAGHWPMEERPDLTTQLVASEVFWLTTSAKYIRLKLQAHGQAHHAVVTAHVARIAGDAVVVVVRPVQQVFHVQRKAQAVGDAVRDRCIGRLDRIDDQIQRTHRRGQGAVIEGVDKLAAPVVGQARRQRAALVQTDDVVRVFRQSRKRHFLAAIDQVAFQVRVVRFHAEAAQPARQEVEELAVAEFHAFQLALVDVARTVHAVLLAVDGFQFQRADDVVLELVLEHGGGEAAGRCEIPFQRHVGVLAGHRFQIRIAAAAAVDAQAVRRGAQRDAGIEVAESRTLDRLAGIEAGDQLVRQRRLDGDVGQHIGIGHAAVDGHRHAVDIAEAVHVQLGLDHAHAERAFHRHLAGVEAEAGLAVEGGRVFAVGVERIRIGIGAAVAAIQLAPGVEVGVLVLLADHQPAVHAVVVGQRHRRTGETRQRRDRWQAGRRRQEVQAFVLVRGFTLGKPHAARHFAEEVFFAHAPGHIATPVVRAAARARPVVDEGAQRVVIGVQHVVAGIVVVRAAIAVGAGRNRGRMGRHFHDRHFLFPLAVGTHEFARDLDRRRDVPPPADGALVGFRIVLRRLVRAQRQRRAGGRDGVDLPGAGEQRVLAAGVPAQAADHELAFHVVVDAGGPAFRVQLHRVRRPPLERPVAGVAGALAARVGVAQVERPGDGGVAGDGVRWRRVPRHFVVVAAQLVRQADQGANIAERRLPAVRHHGRHLRIARIRLVAVFHARGQVAREAGKVERPRRAHVDHAGGAALHHFRALRLVDVDAREHGGRDVGQVQVAVVGRVDFAAVEQRGETGQTANDHAARFAAFAADLHAGHAAENFRHVLVGEFTGFLGNDGIDHFVRVLLDGLGALRRAAYAGHGHGGDGGGGIFGYGLGILIVLGPDRSAAEDAGGRQDGDRQFDLHAWGCCVTPGCGTTGAILVIGQESNQSNFCAVRYRNYYVGKGICPVTRASTGYGGACSGHAGRMRARRRGRAAATRCRACRIQCRNETVPARRRCLPGSDLQLFDVERGLAEGLLVEFPGQFHHRVVIDGNAGGKALGVDFHGDLAAGVRELVILAALVAGDPPLEPGVLVVLAVGQQFLGRGHGNRGRPRVAGRRGLGRRAAVAARLGDSEGGTGQQRGEAGDVDETFHGVVLGLVGVHALHRADMNRILMCGRQRQRDAKATAVEAGAESQAAAVQRGNARHDRQAQAAALLGGGSAQHAIKPFGQALQAGGGHAGAVVAHRDADVLARRHGSEHDAAAVRAIAQRVVEHVAQRDLQHLRMGQHGGARAGRALGADLGIAMAIDGGAAKRIALDVDIEGDVDVDVDGDMAPRGRRAVRLQQLLEQGRQRHRLHGQLFARDGVEPGQREQAVHQRRHAADVVAQFLERRRQFGGPMLALQQLHVHMQSRQRRAQLVRGVGRKTLFRLQRGVEPAQHAVKRLHDGQQFARLAVQRHLREVLRGLGGNGRGGAAQRLQHAADQQPAHQRQQYQEARHGQPQMLGQLFQDVEPFLVLLAHLHFEAAVVVAHHEHAPAAPVNARVGKAMVVVDLRDKRLRRPRSFQSVVAAISI
uniref:Uncharacterized protein n=1 Tax=Tanacetum cinerariifolium TaxID=118510 RepID=A0A699GFA1_TANCI|nr:hypothetical protein [Tanacetum cinerariifolium]